MARDIIKLLLLFILIINIVLSGCIKRDKDQKRVSEDKKVTIVTSFYPMYIFTLNITKDIPNIKVVNMTPTQTGCLHDYQLSTNDLITLESADIFIINGGGMESFMDKVIKQMPKLKIIDACSGIKLVKDSFTGKDNPHVWVSITKAIQQVENIENQLSAFDPGNSKYYKKNSEIYIRKLEELKNSMHKVLDNIKNKDIITFHEAFLYFADEFNLNIVGIVEREPGTEPSARELSDIISLINRKKIKSIFVEPQYPIKSAQTIANETGVKIYILDPVVTGDFNIDSYTDIMRKNMTILEEALN
jgi:zinc transport system substrate-binding protein